jgi:hypothetical protein
VPVFPALALALAVLVLALVPVLVLVPQLALVPLALVFQPSCSLLQMPQVTLMIKSML